MKKTISKRLVVMGLSASAALSAGYLINPWGRAVPLPVSLRGRNEY